MISYVLKTYCTFFKVLEEIDELKEEAEEAKKLAEEWELKYKEMQGLLQYFEAINILIFNIF